MNPRRVLLGTLAAGALLAASCSTSDNRATDSGTVADETSAAVASGSATATGADDDAPSGGGSSGAERPLTDVADVDLIAAQTERKLVYTGAVEAEVDDVSAAVRRAREVVLIEGGHVFAQDQSVGRARIVLKVPSIRFDEAYEAVVAIGEVQSQHVEADDVTEQYVDLESRRETLRASIERLRGFLDRAANADEISRLEAELTRRESDHDAIAGKLRLLDDRTTYGTITADYRLAEGVVADLFEEEQDSGPPGFGGGLARGWDAAAMLAGGAAAVAGFLLPFTPLIVMVLLAGWWWRRRHGGGAATEAPTAA